MQSSAVVLQTYYHFCIYGHQEIGQDSLFKKRLPKIRNLVYKILKQLLSL